MSSIAQIEANRRNAERSTGPRTPEGVAACCRNATRHGLLSSRVLLACESREELEEHARAMKETLQPVGPVEELLADRLAAQAWRLRRVMQLETVILEETLGRFDVLGEERAEESGSPLEAASGRFSTRPGTTAAQNAGAAGLEPRRADSERRRATPAAIARQATRDFLQEGLRGLDILRRYERAIEQGLYQAMRELSALQAARAGDEKARSREGRQRIEAILNDPRLPGILRQYAIDMKKDAERGDAETRRKPDPATFSREPQASAGEPCETDPIAPGAPGDGIGASAEKSAGAGPSCETEPIAPGASPAGAEGSASGGEPEESLAAAGAGREGRYAEAAA